MIAQFRIYTINKGEMDDVLDHFVTETLPLHARLGIEIAGAYVNRPMNEFIWCRMYADAADRDAKQQAIQDSPERIAMGARFGGNVAKMEIRETEIAGASLPTAPQSGNSIAQIRLYTINKGEMGDFLKQFTTETTPMHARLGVNISAAYVNRPQNEVIWIRTYSDAAQRDAQQKAIQESPERIAMGARFGGNVAKMEVREVEVLSIPSVVA